MNQIKKIINEASLSRVESHTQDRNIGMITAHRGGNVEQDDRERNNKNNKRLAADIRSEGLGFIKVKGRYIEGHGTTEATPVDEHSFLVVGKKGNDKGHLLDFLKRHGEKYGQDSILHKSHDSTDAVLHGTNETGYPGKGKTQEVGEFHPNRAGEFHSMLKGNRSFAFESVEFLRPFSFSVRGDSEF